MIIKYEYNSGQPPIRFVYLNVMLNLTDMILFSQIHTPKLFVSVSRDLPPFTSMNTYEQVNASRNPAILATLRSCSSWNNNLESIMGEDMFILDQSLSILYTLLPSYIHTVLFHTLMHIMLSKRDQIR